MRLIFSIRFKVFRFASDFGTIFFPLQGLFVDDEPLLASSSAEFLANRKFRSSDFARMASNFALVVYECDDETRVSGELRHLSPCIALRSLFRSSFFLCCCFYLSISLSPSLSLCINGRWLLG